MKTQIIALDLRGSRSQQVDIHARGSTVGVTAVGPQIRPHMTSVVGEGLGRRDIGRANLRDGSRAGDGLAGRRHHRARMVGIGVISSSGSSRGQMLGLVAAS